MKIFLDSADVDEITESYKWGIVDGITTNPTLLKTAVDKRKQKLDLEIYIKTILKTAKGTPVSIELTETEYEKIVEQGNRFYKLFNHIAKNVCLKIPVNTAFDENGGQFDGLRAIKELSRQKIPINCTLVFTPQQALLAAKAGAKYVSPFVGRIDDMLRDANNKKYSKDEYFPKEGLQNESIEDDDGIRSGIQLVAECVQILKMHNMNCEVIAASLRNPRQVREAALAGAHIATVPISVLRKMVQHKKTYEGMKKFSEDSIKEYSELK